MIRTEAYQADHESRDDGVVAGERLESRPVRKLPTVESLRLQALVEADIGDADTQPRNQARNSSH